MKNCTPQDLDSLRAMRSLGVGGAQTSETVFKWAVENGIPYVDVSGATEAVGAICARRAVSPEASQGLRMILGLEGLLEKEAVSDTHGELIVRATVSLPRQHFRLSFLTYFVSIYPSTIRMSAAMPSLTMKRQRSQRTGQEISTIRSISSRRCPILKERRCQSIQHRKIHYLVCIRNSAKEKTLLISPKGLSYLGRIDDLIVLASGIKINALDLEKTFNSHPDIVRTAVISDIDHLAPVLLVQPLHGDKTYLPREQASKLTDFILHHNEKLSYERRIRVENIIFVQELPATTKLTLNRKKIKKIWLESSGKWPGELPVLSAKPSIPLGCPQDFPSVGGEANAETRRRVKALLVDVFDIPGDDLLDDTMYFSAFALTSSMAMTTLAKALETRFNVHIRAHQLYSLRSIDDICRLVDMAGQDNAEVRATPSACGKSEDSMRTLMSQRDRHSANELVVSGIACCFPGGIYSTAAFWSALLSPETYEARASKSPPTPRWSSTSVDEADLPPVLWLDDKVLDNVEAVADFFQLPPQDVASMSPNARLVLQLGYQALEDAAIAPRSLAGKPWGVYTSVNDSGWRERRATEADMQGKKASISPLISHAYVGLDSDLAQGFIGNADSATGGRLSYFLDLTGPAMEIKTACSSSAVAIHQGNMSISLPHSSLILYHSLYGDPER